ncbi:DNA oxidative demethylase AlkB [Robbsia andropogonis]|uniref:DNA oxidative demethylase AlkB n=1 Tax=Robbsia andropogonis TaxID=28092 RepID=UPI002A6A7630|nr:DNA oxidative demethylase AlkB [Robbsia andropogonis]
MHTRDLFTDDGTAIPLLERVRVGEQTILLRGFALPVVDQLLHAVTSIIESAPLRRMATPGGYTMSVALTNCGTLGWVTDRRGYRYTSVDPQTGQPWPSMPDVIRTLGHDAAHAAGFADFLADACLINQYRPGTKMSLHQDKDERNMRRPIVSVSLGIPAVFQFGGMKRGDPTQRIPLMHGDVVVWGGVDRLRFHGILPVKDAHHREWGRQRINITLRMAG